jgi:selenide,water dikinase
VLTAAWDLVAAGAVPGGTLNNLSYVGARATFSSGVTREAQLVLADAQTSGGLLISVPQERADSLLAELESRGVAAAARIGSATAVGKGHITVEP